ncbi:MAG: SOS response-associated peptidase, partial [Rhodospirillales bacterium]
FDLEDLPVVPDQPEIRPTDQALIIRRPGQGEMLAWGIPASWDSKPLINARSETLAERKSFQPLLANRCLVPATAYFEWRGVGRKRFKNRIAPAAGGPFAFAGLYDGNAFTIITCTPASSIAHIHGRMPVILTREAETAWLDPARPFATLATHLVPYEENPLNAEEQIPPGTQQDLFA